MIDPNKDNEFHVYNVDGTPDADFPLRILRACVENCNWFYYVHQGAIDEKLKRSIELNQRQINRRDILLRAIAILEAERDGPHVD